MVMEFTASSISASGSTSQFPKHPATLLKYAANLVSLSLSAISYLFAVKFYTLASSTSFFLGFGIAAGSFHLASFLGEDSKLVGDASAFAITGFSINFNEKVSLPCFFFRSFGCVLCSNTSGFSSFFGDASFYSIIRLD